MTSKNGVSWGVVILLLFLFFPVGIILLVKKVTSEKHAYTQNAKAMNVLGWVLIALGLLYIVMGLTGEAGETSADLVAVSIIFFCGGGIALVVSAKRFQRRADTFNRYVAIVTNATGYSLDNIAAAYPTSYEQACRDLQKMLDAGYFSNAYLDLEKRELIMPKVSAPNFQNIPVGTPPKPRAVKCSGCGATNMISDNGIGECEYCGSPL